MERVSCHNTRRHCRFGILADHFGTIFRFCRFGHFPKEATRRLLTPPLDCLMFRGGRLRRFRGVSGCQNVPGPVPDGKQNARITKGCVSVIFHAHDGSRLFQFAGSLPAAPQGASPSCSNLHIIVGVVAQCADNCTLRTWRHEHCWL